MIVLQLVGNEVAQQQRRQANRRRSDRIAGERDPGCTFAGAKNGAARKPMLFLLAINEPGSFLDCRRRIRRGCCLAKTDPNQQQRHKYHLGCVHL
jgi:hypothetical protein